MKRIVICLAVVVLFNLSFNIVAYGDDMKKGKEIIIDIPSRKLFLLEDSKVLKEYPVGVGKAWSQTPLGNFKIGEKLKNRPYYTKKIPGGSPYNPLGSRWIEFYKGAYAIHGNSNPSSIGGYVSAGCVRMFERDVQELYEEVALGVPVTVQYKLIKVLKDVDGENPILMVYQDEYNKKKNLHGDIENTLKDLGIYDSISLERIKYLNKHVEKWNTVYSDNWTYFINDQYITKDVVIVDDEKYVNKKKLETFFNIPMYSLDGEEYCDLAGNKVREKIIDDKKYISINSLEAVLGGEHNTEKDIMRIDFKLVNYIFLNDKLVIGQGKDLIDNPTIPLESIITPLNMQVKMEEKSTKIFYKEKEINYSYFNNKPYITLDSLINDLELGVVVNTSKDYIKIYSDPLIVKNGVIYQGKRVNGDIYAPVDVVKEEREVKSEEVSNTNEESLKKIDEKLYYKLFNVEYNLIRRSYLYDNFILIR